MDLVAGVYCFFVELDDVHLFVELADVDEMVGDLDALFKGWFGCADVHAFVELHGVAGDDFTANF